MKIVGFFDLHRQQITYDYLDLDSGEVCRGQIRPADRCSLRQWLTRFPSGSAVFGVEGCTGWRFVVEELQRAGLGARLAEPAETACRRGPKRRAKTDRADARHGRELLCRGELPDSWIPPAHLLEVRTLTRLYGDLMEESNAWQQRIHATLYHHGAPARGRDLLRLGLADRLADAEMSPAGSQAVTTAWVMLEHLQAQLDPLRRQLQAHGRRQPGCRALRSQYGIAELTATIIWAELGDCRRFASSRQAVRHAGLDISVHDSDGKRAPGHLTRQGPPALRWALFEAAVCASRPASPDYRYYRQVADRVGHNRAVLAVARKLLRRCYHTLIQLGDQALAPAG